MKRISTSSLIDLKSVFNSADDNVHHYRLLKRSFNKNEFGVELAEPIVRQNSGEIIWKAETELELKTIDSISDELRAEAGQMMRKAFEAFEAVMRGNKEISDDFSKKIKEIPGKSSVLVGKFDNKVNVVITNWGFLEDTLDRNSGILESLFPAPSYSILVRLLSETNVPFSGKRIRLESNSRGSQDTTDENGGARMGGLTRGTVFSVFDQNGKMLAGNLVADGTKEYVIRIPKEIQLKIQAVTGNGRPVVNQQFSFSSVDLGKIEFSTDNNGEFIINHPVCESEFKIYFEDQEIYFDKIPNDDKVVRLEFDPPVLEIEEEEPKPKMDDGIDPIPQPIRIKFTNFWNRPIKNQSFIITGESHVEINAVTNKSGEASIAALTSGEHEIRFKKKRSVWNYKFLHNSGDACHHFTPRFIYPWLWWIISGILLFLFLCCFFNCESCRICGNDLTQQEYTSIADDHTDVIDNNDDLDSYRDSLGGDQGVVTITLSWNTRDDLDLYLLEPSGDTIYYKMKQSRSGGELDIDMNADELSNRPIENINYNSTPPSGEYTVGVNFYKRNEIIQRAKVPYQVYIKVRDEILTLEKYHSKVGETHTVYKFEL